jgi:cystathionine beta-lyase
MMGSVTATEAYWSQLRRSAQLHGQCVSPDDASLAARGLRTLDVRLKAHEQNGLAVAHWLKQQPEVARVLHPALEDCPGHESWKRDFRGASGLFSFVLNGGDDAARARLIDGLEHFGIGFSWGGYESLALPVDPASIRSATGWQAEGPLVRLHIGLEDPEDLIADLARGLARFRGA